MRQTLLCLSFVFCLCKAYGVDAYDPCGGNDWVAYEDEKCLKFIDKLVTHDEAEKICNQEKLQTDSFIPTSVTIKSTEEQEHLNKFLFRTFGVLENVWIGAQRQTGSCKNFVWNDGSEIDFANWAEGSPSEEVERDCVQLESKFVEQSYNISKYNKRSINGKWVNVPCNNRNLIICQKLQTWSFPQLQKTLLDARKELKDSLENARMQFNSLEQNLLPIGFIYVQLPGQPEPWKLWETVDWTEITSDYAGLFFRVLGGNSAHFGVTQDENSPRLTEASTFHVGGSYTHHTPIAANGEWNGRLWTGSSYGGIEYYYGMQFKVSSGEVRPRNTALRIWKRIKKEGCF